MEVDSRFFGVDDSKHRYTVLRELAAPLLDLVSSEFGLCPFSWWASRPMRMVPCRDFDGTLMSERQSLGVLKKEWLRHTFISSILVTILDQLSHYRPQSDQRFTVLVQITWQ
jgi:hypothetical protein